MTTSGCIVGCSAARGAGGDRSSETTRTAGALPSRPCERLCGTAVGTFCQLVGPQEHPCWALQAWQVTPERRLWDSWG